MEARKTPTQALNMDASGSSVHLCPICNSSFHGDLPAFERHVNHHLDGIEEEDIGAQTERDNSLHWMDHCDNRDRLHPLLGGHQVEVDNNDEAANDAMVMTLAKQLSEQAYQIATDHQLARQLESADPGHDACLESLTNGHDTSMMDMEVECEIFTCRAKVRFRDMQRHMDHHLAQQLAQHGSASVADEIDRTKSDNLTLRILQEDGTLRSIVVKRSFDTLDATGASATKKERLMMDSSTPSSSDIDRHKDVVPSADLTLPSSLRTTGQTTLNGFLCTSSKAPSASSSSSSPSTGGSNAKQWTFLPKPASSKACPGMVTNLIPRLATLLQAAFDAKGLQEAYLADPSVAFCPGDQTDKGWGCGYRNIQMMLSYVVQQPSLHGSCPTSQPLAANPVQGPTDESLNEVQHDDDGLPTILQLQRQLEYAWHDRRIDPEGANQLKRKVVGTRKWIGTTEAWTVLTSLGIRSQILDFHQPTGPDNTHPVLFQTVLEYFRSPPGVELQPPAWMAAFGDPGAPSSTATARHGPVVAGGASRPTATTTTTTGQRGVFQTRKPPLYMQHQGHSRTIVGIEVHRPGVYSLLVFDPGRKLPARFMQVPPTPPTAAMANQDKRSRLASNTTTATTATSAGITKTAIVHKAATTTNVEADQSLLRPFRLWLAAGYTKAQYQLLGISGLSTAESEEHQQTRSTVAGDALPRRQVVAKKNKLVLMSPNTALSIGWDAQERQDTKYPISKRIP